MRYSYDTREPVESTMVLCTVNLGPVELPRDTTECSTNRWIQVEPP